MKIEQMKLERVNDDDEFQLRLDCITSREKAYMIMEFFKYLEKQLNGQEDQVSQEDDGQKDEFIIECRHKKRQKM